MRRNKLKDALKYKQIPLRLGIVVLLIILSTLDMNNTPMSIESRDISKVEVITDLGVKKMIEDDKIIMDLVTILNESEEYHMIKCKFNFKVIIYRNTTSPQAIEFAGDGIPIFKTNNKYYNYSKNTEAYLRIYSIIKNSLMR